MGLLDRFFAQLSTLQTLWMPFVVALVIVGFGIWKAMDWRYNGIIARLREDVTYLERAVARPGAPPPSPPTPPKSYAPAQPISMGSSGKVLPPTTEREFLPDAVTPELITSLRKDLTGMQADRIIASYEGKWMRVHGTVYKTGFTHGETYVSLTVGEPEDKIDMLRNQVTFWFDGEKDELMAMKVGDHFTGQGQVQNIDDLGIILIHSEPCS